jgi:hypothetical protein
MSTFSVLVDFLCLLYKSSQQPGNLPVCVAARHHVCLVVGVSLGQMGCGQVSVAFTYVQDTEDSVFVTCLSSSSGQKGDPFGVSSSFEVATNCYVLMNECTVTVIMHIVCINMHVCSFIRMYATVHIQMYCVSIWKFTHGSCSFCDVIPELLPVSILGTKYFCTDHSNPANIHFLFLSVFFLFSLSSCCKLNLV